MRQDQVEFLGPSFNGLVYFHEVIEINSVSVSVDPSETQDAGNFPTPIVVPENNYKGVSHFHNISPFDRR